MQFVNDMKREGRLLWTTLDQYRLLSFTGDGSLDNGINKVDMYNIRRSSCRILSS